MKTTLAIRTTILCAAMVAGAAMAQDAKWLPADVSGVARINTKALRAIPFLKALADKNLKDSTAPQFQNFAVPKWLKGVEEQVDSVLIGFLPKGEGTEAPSCGFVTGTFNADEVAAALVKDGCTKETIDGVTAYVNRDASGKGQWIAFPRKGVAVVADTAQSFSKALASMGGKAKGLAADSMYARALAKDYPVVAALDSAGLFQNGEQLPMLNTPPPKLLGFSIRQKGDNAILANLTGVFDNAEAAKALADGLNGLKMVGIMKMSADPNGADLAKFLSSVSVTSSEKNAIVSAVIDQALVDALQKGAMLQ